MAQIPWSVRNFNFTEVCVKNGVDVVTHPYYRAMQFLHIALCVPSVVLLLWILTGYRSQITFHHNTRVLFMSLLVASLVHASLMTIFECYQLVLSYTYSSPCDVILPRLFYASVHLPFAFSVLWMESAQITMLLERIIAILHVVHYETCTKKLGSVLLLLSFIFPLIECSWAYMGEKFEAPQISCLNTPVSRTLQINVLFGFTTVCHSTVVIATTIVYLCNRKRKRTEQTLTSRFQFTENITSSRLMIILSALQLTIFSVYSASTMYLRATYHSSTSISMYRSNILLAYLVPLFTLLLPMVTMIFLKTAKRCRESNIRSLIQMKASGAEGWANYSSQLEQQWGGI